MRETRATRSRTQQASAQDLPSKPRPPLDETAMNSLPRQEPIIAAPSAKSRLRSARPALGLTSSPARRVVRVIPLGKRQVSGEAATSTPPTMRRCAFGTSQPAVLLAPSSQQRLPKSPERKVLGSPVRLTSAETNMPEQRIPSTSTVTTRSPLKQPAQRPAPSSKIAVVPASGKKPANKIEPRVAVSPLKKPPTRFLHNTPSKSNTQRAFADEDPDEVDELSLPIQTPAKKAVVPIPSAKYSKSATQTHITPARVMPRSGRSPIPTVSSILDQDDDEDAFDDELAIQQLTPGLSSSPENVIRVGMAVGNAMPYSPPTEEDLEQDWQPSINLTKSFSELTLQQKQQRDITTTRTHSRSPQHLSFDEEGHALPIAAPVPQFEPSNMIIFIDVQPTGVLANTHAAEEYGQALEALGCRVFPRWNWNPDTQTPAKTNSGLARRIGVTHVVFFNGSARTLRKVQQARLLGVPVECIALSWAGQCRTLQRLTVGTAGHQIDVDEELKLLALSDKGSQMKQQSVTERDAEITIPKRTPTAESFGIASSDDECQAVFPIEDLILEEYLEPIQFGDLSDVDNEAGDIGLLIDPALLAISAAPTKECVPVLNTSPVKRNSVPQKNVGQPIDAAALQRSLTELEERGLQLARRNSFKFKPRLSSPLAK